MTLTDFINFITKFFIDNSIGFYLGLVGFSVMFWPYLNRRKHFFLRYLITIAIELVVIYFVPDYRLHSALPSLKTLSIYLSFIVLNIVSFENDIKKHIFCDTAVLTTQHLSLCVVEVFTLLFGITETDNAVLYMVLNLIGAIAIFFIVWFFFARTMKQNSEVRILSGKLIAMAVFLFLVVFIFQRIVITFDELTWSFRFFDGLTCFLGLIIMFSEFQKTNETFERRMIEELMKNEEKRYKLLELSMDAINKKSHDLKYIESAGGENNSSKVQLELDNYAEAYDDILVTGNSALDNTITEKSLYCKKHSITFTYIINVKNFNSVNKIDLIVILGNIIDNAIECVEKYSEEKRIISLNINDKAQVLQIHIENYCEDEITFINGLPNTHKKDSNNHGIGVKSVKYIVDKYNGAFNIDYEDKMFNVDIILPYNKNN